MNNPSIDDRLSSVLGVGTPDEALRRRIEDAIRTGTVAPRQRSSAWTVVKVSAALVFLLVAVVIANALVSDATYEPQTTEVIAAAINLLEPPAPGTVRHVSYTVSIAYPSIDDPSAVSGESWDRMNDDGSITRAVLVHDEAGALVGRAIYVNETIWLDQDGQIIPPDVPAAVPPEVATALTALNASTEEFLYELRTSEDLNSHTIERRRESGSYIITIDMTDDILGGENGAADKAEFEAEFGVKVDGIRLEFELSDSLDRFLRREFFVITPSGQVISVNRIENRLWEDVDASDVDPRIFSTEFPMTAAPAE